MSVGGYSTARQKSETVARNLRDIARLIGEGSSASPSGLAAEPVELETGGGIVPGLGMVEDATALDIRARDLTHGLFKIIVLGEFKNGKSTLLNGMLGSKTLPAKAAPATAIITVLMYGDSDRVAIYETGAPQPRTVSWEEFVREFQLSLEDQETLQDHGTVDRFRQIEYAQVECRYPICANGVKLIDSPGLGEHISRTRVATNFLKQSQAVIFVLNATRILGQDERDFIDNILGSGMLTHVFFVVNRINQVNPSDVEDIKRWTENGLRHHFLDERGNFDRGLYQRRVFFVDAKRALDLRMSPPADEAQMEATGVPALERELERFLTSEEKVAAMLQSTVQLLLPIAAQARRRIDQQKVALDQPLDQLERRRAEAERQLLALDGRKREIQRTILLFGESIKQKVFANLRSYLDEMHDTWVEDSHHLIDLDGAISIKNLLASYTQREAREQMAQAISEQVQRYLQVKFGQWADRIPTIIERDVELMLEEVEAQVDDFQLELDQIAGLFAGTPTPEPWEREGVSGARLMNLALSLHEITGMTDSIMGVDDWSSTIGMMAQQALIVMLVSFFIGNILIAVVLVEAIHLGLHENEIKKRIREELGKRLYESLQEQVAEKRAFVYEAIEGRFQQFAENMTQVIQTQINTVRAEQERIVRQKQDEHFSVDTEKARLDAIGARVAALVGELSEAAYGRQVA